MSDPITLNDLEAQPFERTKSGIRGFDVVSGGGLGRGAIYLVMGRPGTGKTTLGNQLAFSHARQKGRAVYLTLLSESHSTMLRNLRSMAFFDEKLINDGLVYVGGYRALRDERLKGLLGLVRRLIRDERASLLILDGISPARAFAESDVALKEFIVELQALGTMTGCTTVLLANMTSEDANGPEHTMVDGLIELAFERSHRSTLRTFEVMKFRGSNHLLGRHELAISSEGVVIHPRIEDVLDGSARPAVASDQRVTTGAAELDQMLGGGLLAGTTTVVLGFTGSGKTTLGLQFLDAGARAGEPGLYFGFYESPSRLFLGARQVGLDLEKHEKAGLFTNIWQPPYECGLDSLADRLLEHIAERGIKRLVVDGLDGIRQAATVPGRTIRFFTALSNELRRQGVTTLVNDETRKMNGPEVELRVEGVSALADNIVLLEYVTVGTDLRRLVSIIKARGTAHTAQLREFRLAQGGLAVASDSVGALEVVEASKDAADMRRNRTARSPSSVG